MQITLNINVKKVLTVAACLVALTATFFAGEFAQSRKTANVATVAPVTLDMSTAVPLAWCDSLNHATEPVKLPAGFKGDIFDALASCPNVTMAERFDPRYQAVK